MAGERVGNSLRCCSAKKSTLANAWLRCSHKGVIITDMLNPVKQIAADQTSRTEWEACSVSTNPQTSLDPWAADLDQRRCWWAGNIAPKPPSSAPISRVCRDLFWHQTGADRPASDNSLQSACSLGVLLTCFFIHRRPSPACPQSHAAGTCCFSAAYSRVCFVVVSTPYKPAANASPGRTRYARRPLPSKSGDLSITSNLMGMPLTPCFQSLSERARAAVTSSWTGSAPQPEGAR